MVVSSHLATSNGVQSRVGRGLTMGDRRWGERRKGIRDRGAFDGKTGMCSLIGLCGSEGILGQEAFVALLDIYPCIECQKYQRKTEKSAL